MENIVKEALELIEQEEGMIREKTLLSTLKKRYEKEKLRNIIIELCSSQFIEQKDHIVFITPEGRNYIEKKEVAS
jgi:phosphoribosylaminoimidazole carboxylase (NCAIR synthetase)